jgi:hypothetical protein
VLYILRPYKREEREAKIVHKKREKEKREKKEKGKREIQNSQKFAAPLHSFERPSSSFVHS